MSDKLSDTINNIFTNIFTSISSTSISSTSSSGRKKKKSLLLEKTICPKCGKIGRKKIEPRGRKLYILYDHYYPTTKERIRCYIGPASDADYLKYALAKTNLEIKSQDILEIVHLLLERYVQEQVEKINCLTTILDELRTEAIRNEEQKQIEDITSNLNEIIEMIKRRTIENLRKITNTIETFIGEKLK